MGQFLLNYSKKISIKNGYIPDVKLDGKRYANCGKSQVKKNKESSTSVKTDELVVLNTT